MGLPLSANPKSDFKYVEEMARNKLQGVLISAMEWRGMLGQFQKCHKGFGQGNTSPNF